MAEEDAPAAEQQATPQQAPPADQSSTPEDPAKAITKQILQTCLTKGLASLCKEKPEQPVRWLAEWLLEHNPNKPVIKVPAVKEGAEAKIPANSTGSVVSMQDVKALASSRTGTTLTAMHCLVALDLSKGAMSSNSKSAPIAGCTYYHQMTSSRVASIGACSSAGARAALEDVLIMPGEKPSGITWVSAGEETVVYVGGVPYALRTISSAMVPVTSEGGVEAQNGLKADVLAEVSSHGGRMVVFDASGVPRWITVAAGTVFTPAEAIAGSACKGTPVGFTSLPTPSHGALPSETLNALMDDILSKLSPTSCLVLSSAGDSESAALLTVICTMYIRVRDAGGKMPPDVTPKEPLPVVSKYKPERGLLEDVPQVTSLVSALGVELGGSAKLLADDTVDRAHLCKLKHMRDMYISSKDSSCLAQYLQVVAVAAMLLSPPEKRAEIGDAFSASMAPTAAA